MLVLRRKVGESIVLAGVINISVLAVEGERVKIGISAPPDVTIVREELLRASMTDVTPNQGQSNSAAPASQR
jgi:carbon storage regulator